MTSTIPSVKPPQAARQDTVTTGHPPNPWVQLGLAAGPLFLVTSLIQALLRPGFDLIHNAASELSVGPFGWIQDLNFAAAGALSVCAAIGVRRSLAGTIGGVWIPRLLAVVGVGLGAAAFFHPDPSDGFPPGTAAGASATSYWHGVLHMVCGSAAFLALIVACFVFGRRSSRAGDRRWATFSRSAGLLFALVLPLSGGHDGGVILFIGVSIGWLAVTACTLHTVRPEQGPGRPRASLLTPSHTDNCVMKRRSNVDI